MSEKNRAGEARSRAGGGGVVKFKRRYLEKYKKGVYIPKYQHPKRMSLFTRGTKILEVEVIAAGVGEDESGGRIEFHEFRFYVKPPEERP